MTRKPHSKLVLQLPGWLGRWSPLEMAVSHPNSPLRYRMFRIFKLAEAAEKGWRRPNGHNHFPKIILGVKFTDGIEVVRPQAQPAAA